MKTIKLLLILLVATSTTTFASISKKHNDVSVLSVKRDIFYFKVCEDFVGAQIEVYSSTGELMASGELSHRKAIVDFFFENAGTYTIKITKEGRVRTFDYQKSNPSPVADTDSMHHVLISQE